MSRARHMKPTKRLVRARRQFVAYVLLAAAALALAGTAEEALALQQLITFNTPK